ncbi:MAG: DUF1007 family protein [Pseudolabrys sp.]|nr:DUF1007 family protein [Pseudolabrys sp.]
MSVLLRILVILLGVVGATTAQAHPHVWVTMKTDVVYGSDGSITGIRHAWAFDDMFSAFATQGIEQKTKGEFTREELAPLAEVNVTSLKEYDYFTYLTADGKKVELTDPVKGQYWLDYKDSVLVLNFVLPLKQPLKARNVDIDVYDPTIFVDFSFEKQNPVKLDNAPSGCKVGFQLPREMTFQESKRLAQIPADQQNTSMAWGAQFANKIKVTCP